MHSFRQRFSAYRAGVAAPAYLAFVIIAAIVVELVPGLDPHALSDKVMAAPSLDRPLGTDGLGRESSEQLCRRPNAGRRHAASQFIEGARTGTDTLQDIFDFQSVYFTNAPGADSNNCGAITVQDIFDFLNAWFASDIRADYNGVNGLEVQDVFDFVNAWFTGCP